MYFKGVYESTGKISPMNKASRDLGISYLKIRESLARIYSALFLKINIINNNTSTSSSISSSNSNDIYKKKEERRRISFIEYYSFIEEMAEKAYNSTKNYNERRKEKSLEGRTIWNGILSRVQESYNVRIPSGFYWKTQTWLKNLIKGIEEENISEYTEWWIDSKVKLVKKFNAGIFCCDSMIDEYKKDMKDWRMSRSRKRIVDKKKDFKKDSRKEDLKMLDKILMKMEEVDRGGEGFTKYEKRCMMYLKKKGLIHSEF